MRVGRRGTYIWLGLIGVIVALLTLSGALGAFASILFVGAYLSLLAGVFATERLRQLQNVLPTLAVNTRTTPAARAAVGRARRLTNYNTDEVVTDVGVIVNEQNKNGRWQRRIAQSVSTDDQALQPYVKINVPPEISQRVALIKFDVLDRTGKVQFSRQVEQYVRDGENLIPSDQQLPMRGNDKLGRTGTWDLHVSINGTLAACHSFVVAPAVAERRARLADDGEARLSSISVPADKEDDGPLSLEELLREQREELSHRS